MIPNPIIKRVSIYEFAKQHGLKIQVSRSGIALHEHRLIAMLGRDYPSRGFISVSADRLGAPPVFGTGSTRKEAVAALAENASLRYLRVENKDGAVLGIKAPMFHAKEGLLASVRRAIGEIFSS